MSRASSPRVAGTRQALRGGAVPLGSVVRQARADAGPLAVAMVLVALVAFITAIVPRAADRAAVDEIRAAVAAPDSGANVVVSAPLFEDFVVPRPLLKGTAEDTAWVATFVAGGLPQVFEPPVTSIVSRDLRVAGVRDQPSFMRLAFTTADGGSGVTWVDGRAPGAAEGAEDAAKAGLAFPIEIGLSIPAADTLGVSAGDSLTVLDPSGAPLELNVVGVFWPRDESGPEWTVVPNLLRPAVIGGGAARTQVVGLLTDESLPYARLALPLGQLTRSFTFAVVPERLDASNAGDVTSAIQRLVAGSDDIGSSWLGTTVRTRIDVVLEGAESRITSARAQASLVLVGVLAAALLVILLAAGLVSQRRLEVLTHLRSHGGSLSAVAGALLLESTVATVAAGVAGLAVAARVVPGPILWTWVAPPLVFAALAAPAWGTAVAARRAAPPPARSLDNRPGIRSAAGRRLALEATALLVTAGSLLTLRSRGVGATSGSVGADLFVLAAPVLVAVTVALAVLRIAPPLWSALRHWTQRTRGPVSALAASRTRTVGLPLAALVVTTSLLAVALALDATVRDGQVDGSWESVGADAVVTPARGGSLPEDAASIREAVGVDSAVFAVIAPSTQLLGGGLALTARVVVVDAAELQAMLAATPLDDAPQLELLISASNGSPELSVLTSDIPDAEPGLTLRWAGVAVPIVQVGVAPRVPGDGSARTPTVIVDRDALGQALGGSTSPSLAGTDTATTSSPLDPTTERQIASSEIVWVAGSGAESAVREAVGTEDVTILTRLHWLEARRAAPVTAAMTVLIFGAAATLLALLALVVALVASAGAPARATALAGVRVLGLSRASASRIAAVEVIVPILLAGAVGTATGFALAGVLADPLGLSALTGQSGPPSLVVPWWTWLPLAVLLVAGLGAVGLERMRRRRECLGQVMRSA